MPTPPQSQNPESWLAVKALFEQALDLPAEARDAFIAAAPVDAGVRSEALSLLAHHSASSRTQEFMAVAATQVLVGTAARAGQRLGAWEIVRPLGAGGMGEVFEARRADGQYQGRAAIKLLKRGMDSAAVLQRFALERQALARLHHPHIASLLDAGLSADGLPFFVMEFVDGVPLDEAVSGRTVEQRLALFLQLSDAVSHAHRALLVHRDLKPGNVLVTADGQVKLLDFGIAKALDPSEAADAVDGDTTVGNVRPFTPNYASPEQVRGEPVTTATDIYSLGVLLYQLLTGVRPTGRKASNAAEVARSVLEETPTRPSSLGGNSGEGLASDAQWLATRKRLSGDLDNILLKALEKPINRRYASVDALAQDLRRYLGGYPVSARAPSAGYVLGKFVRRNRALVGAGALASLAVLVGLAGTAWQAHRAAQALEVAQARLKDIRTLSKDVLVRYGDAVTHLPGGMQIKAQLLTDTLGYLDRLLAEGDADEPGFKGEIAMAYARLAELQVENNLSSLDRSSDGGRSAERAIALFAAAEAGAPDDPLFYMWWGRAHSASARVLRTAGKIDLAVAQMALAAPMLKRGLLSFPGNKLIRSELGSVLFLTGQMQDTMLWASKGNSDGALASFEQSSLIYQALLREDKESPRQPGSSKPSKNERPDNEVYADVFQLGTIDGARALVYLKRNELEKAQQFGRSAVAYREQAAAMVSDNMTLFTGLAIESANLTAINLELGDKEAALQSARKVWRALDEVRRQEPDRPGLPAQYASAGLHHGRALLLNGMAAEALPLLKLSEDALLARVSAAASGGPALAPAQLSRLARIHMAQAGALWRLGQGPAALAKAQASRTALQALADKTPSQATLWMWLGELALLQAGAVPAEKTQWLASARASYARAAALAPLAGMHLANWTSLNGKT